MIRIITNKDVNVPIYIYWMITCDKSKQSAYLWRMCYVWSGIKQDLEMLLLGKAKLQANNLAVKVINVTLRV